MYEYKATVTNVVDGDTQGMNLRKAAQQALEALCLPCDRWNRRQTEIINASITALRAALADQK